MSGEEMLQIRIAFAGNRIAQCSCTCPEFTKQTIDELQDGSFDEYRAVPPSFQRPCAHIGAVLLVLKKKQEEEDAEGEQTDRRPRKPLFVHPDRRLSAAQKAQETIDRQRLSKYTVSTLRSMLARNHQKKAGTKEELVNRSVDGMARGALPKCPLCQQGQLWYCGGKYRCYGSFDQRSLRRVPCSFEAAVVARNTWIT